MPGRAIVAPVSFGALYDFAVDQLPLGPLATWPSLVDNTTMPADGATMPTVITDGASKTVRFNGTIDRMRIDTNLNTAHSVVVVAKLRAPITLDQIVYGKTANSEGAIGIHSSGGNYAGYGGGSTLLMSPTVVPDTNWHVFILTHAGASSAVRVDNSETTGNLPVAQRDGITLGFLGTADNRSEIDYKRVALIPGAMTTAQRTAIVAQLKAQYGI
jgi:hypothetical protein